MFLAKVTGSLVATQKADSMRGYKLLLVEPYRVDPDNRLVTSELERRWNQALQRVDELEQRIDLQRSQSITRIAPTLEEFQSLAGDLEIARNLSSSPSEVHLSRCFY